MAITDDHYAEIDAELQRIRDYLADLADEFDPSAIFPGGALHSSAVSAHGAIAMLRHMLTQAQEHESAGEEMRRRLSGGKK